MWQPRSLQLPACAWATLDVLDAVTHLTLRLNWRYMSHAHEGSHPPFMQACARLPNAPDCPPTCSLKSIGQQAFVFPEYATRRCVQKKYISFETTHELNSSICLATAMPACFQIPQNVPKSALAIPNHRFNLLPVGPHARRTMSKQTNTVLHATDVPSGYTLSTSHRPCKTSTFVQPMTRPCC